ADRKRSEDAEPFQLAEPDPQEHGPADDEQDDADGDVL
ncbi:hypothetical protein LCGC14_1753470, partial [marine sediment metagenome]